MLKNRIVMAPMTRSRAIGNEPNVLMATYYAQRASAALIITESTSPSINGLGYCRMPGIFTQAQTESWKLVTDAVHGNDGKIVVQLTHTGRIAHSANLPHGGAIMSPSPVSADAPMWTDTLGMQKTESPMEMSALDIKNTTNEYVLAAKNAIEAGFDGVELHAANGYLLEQFLNPYSNTRSDEYGGSVHNRTRFVTDVVKAVVNAIGADKVGLRISPYGTLCSMQNYTEIPETYIDLSAEMEKLNLWYLHIVDYAARASEEGRLLLQNIRKSFKNTIILNGGYTKERAISAIENNEADLISFGSLFISNPNLPEKLQNNISLTAPDPSLFYTTDEKGYTDYI